MSTEIVKFEQLQETVTGILEYNQDKVAKATDAYNTYMAKLEKGMTEELSTEGDNLTKKIRKTITHLNEKRTPVTQALDLVRKEFTNKEAALKTFGENITTLITEFRTAKLKEEQEKERLIKLESDKKIETANKEFEIKEAIEKYVLAWSKEKLSKLNEVFYAMTLDSVKETEKAINDFDIAYTQDIHNKFDVPFFSAIIDVVQLKINVLGVTYSELKVRVEKYLVSNKSELLSRIPSRVEELKHIAETAKNNKSAAQELERIAADKRAKEAKEAEQKALLEAEEQRKKAEAEKNATQMQASFEASAASSKIERSGYNMEITHNAAYANIFQLWFQQEGCKLDPETFEKRTIKQMKTFCEKHAHKTGEFIKHQGIQYHEIAK